MLKNHLKIAWRNLSKNRLYTLLHVLGLGLGLITCLFLYTYIDFHRSFDRFHAKADRTFRLVNELHLQKTEYSRGASYAMYQALKTEMPEVEDATFLLANQEFTLKIGENRHKTGQQAALTSSSWFELFDFDWLKGNPNDLDEANTMALSAQSATRYFGNADPMGQAVLVDNKHPFKVVGIIDDSRNNTSLKADVYLSLSSIRTLQPGIMDQFFSYWGFINSSNNVFVSLQHPSQKEAVEQKLMQLAAKNLDPSVTNVYNFKLLPLEEVHFDTNYGGTAKRSLLVVLAIIGGCIMVVASINYINLSVAQQARRSVEIGTRKVLGGSGKQLFVQFLVESALITLAALCLSLVFIPLALPLANQYILATAPIQLLSWTHLLAFSFMLWLVISLAAGVYPAYVLAKLNVFDALKNKVPLRNRTGRQSLVVVQNVVAQVMLMVTIVFVLQVRFLQHTDLGFDRESVVIVPLPKEAGETANLLAEFLGNDSRITAHSLCFQPPAGTQRWGGTVLFDNRPEWEEWPARYAFADSNYIQTFGIQLVAGRNIRQEAAEPEYLINELMVSSLGYQQAADILGKRLLAGGMNDQEAGVIVGVVNDFNTHSLLSAIEPVVIGYVPERLGTLAIKLGAAATREVTADLQKYWASLFSDEVFSYTFLDDQINLLYEKEAQQQKLIWIAAILAIVISSLGLLGMISLMTLLRTKEIGVRKVLGASVGSLVRLLSLSFVKVIGIAFLIAVPIAWWLMGRWLADFAYRIDIEWWMFGLGGLLAAAIALATVGIQAVKAASANPVESLRDE